MLSSIKKRERQSSAEGDLATTPNFWKPTLNYLNGKLKILIYSYRSSKNMGQVGLESPCLYLASISFDIQV